VLEAPENQPHRGEVAKLQVHRRARRRGVGERLLRAAEEVALGAGKTLLVLDTASRDAERLYDRLGWQRAGVVPGYALWPTGGLADTTIYYKVLTAAAEVRPGAP
jgi:GNAT superfamily N-acetyltransferase